MQSGACLQCCKARYSLCLGGVVLCCMHIACIAHSELHGRAQAKNLLAATNITVGGISDILEHCVGMCIPHHPLAAPPGEALTAARAGAAGDDDLAPAVAGHRAEVSRGEPV